MRELARTGAIRQFHRRAASGIGLLGIALWMAGMILVGLIAVALIQRPHRPTSVVLIVLDTVRADHCSAYGYSAPTTPRLAALASDGLLFEHARAAAPWTLPSHASLFTGLLPEQHGCTWEHRWLVDRFDTMAERLSASGRETFGVTTNANASSLYHLDQGFTTFVETWTRRTAHRGLDDSGIANAEVDAWLTHRDSRQPFFLFVNFADAHLPYAPPPPYDRQFGQSSERSRALAANANLLQDSLLGKVEIAEGDRAGFAALYDGDVRAADARLGELLDLLARHGVEEDTLVIVTSDHGEQLGERGEVDHQLSLSEELLRVPLVVRFPGRVKPARVPEPVALTDLKLWIDEIADGRLPDWSPPPDRMPSAFVAQQALPVDLIDLVTAAGRDASAIDRRLAVAWRPQREGGIKLLREVPGVESLWRVDSAGREERMAAPPGDLLADMHQALFDVLAIEPFVEVAADLATDIPAELHALEQARKLGYLSAAAAVGVGMHASEHWNAGRRAAVRRDWSRAISEMMIVAELAPGEPMILFEIAQAVDRSGDGDAIGPIERFLNAVGSGSPAPANAVEWATIRLAELRKGRGP